MTTRWDIDAAWFDRLETEYGLFLEYAPDIRRALIALEKDPPLFAAVREAWDRLDASPAGDLLSVPVPQTADPEIASWMRLILLLPFIPPMMEAYRRHGYPEAEVRVIFRELYDCISLTEKREGVRGLTDLYYDWVLLFIKNFFLHFRDFRFELAVYQGNGAYFHRRGTDAECVCLAAAGVWHRSGYLLGCAGYEDPEGSFAASWKETDTAWCGNAVERGMVRPETRTLPKSGWIKVLAKGDPALKLHINPGADITHDHVMSVMSGARKIYEERFGLRCLPVLCESWLLDPVYHTLLGEGSRIVSFGDQFCRLSQKSGGDEVFNFVFGTRPADLHDLPENTRLFRALKERYLAGGAVHGFEGLYGYMPYSREE